MLLNGIKSQAVDRSDVVVVRGVGMPCLWIAVSVTVKEDDDIGKMIVIFNNVGKIYVGFAALVPWGVMSGAGVVNSINCSLPSIEY